MGYFSYLFWCAGAVYVYKFANQIYSTFTHEACHASQPMSECMAPLHEVKDKLYTLEIYSSKRRTWNRRKSILVHENREFDLAESFEEDIVVKLPIGTRANGTAYSHVFLFTKECKKPLKATTTKCSMYAQGSFTVYKSISSEEHYLLDSLTAGAALETKPPQVEYITHWKTKMSLRFVYHTERYPRRNLPIELRNQWKAKKYNPVFYIDEQYLFRSHKVPLSSNKTEGNPTLTLMFKSTSPGVRRLLYLVNAQKEALREYNFSEEDLEEVLQLVNPDRLYTLAFTYFISFAHSILSILAFKNDIGFWKGRENMEGLSQKAIIGEAACSVIIFFYLLDCDSSVLILATEFGWMLLSMWKCLRVMKFKLSFSGLVKEDSTANEQKTNEFDSSGFTYLTYLLWPLVIGYAIYSLIYHEQKSWYSWFISSAASGVYGFGFLLMTPQLFINYKMKSTAHLPWRALTYKFLNTFIDDVFAFIIEMPTMHRLATLRDDLVFFIYLYQKWIYPTDKTRPNEFGIAYESKDDVLDQPISKNSEVKKNQ